MQARTLYDKLWDAHLVQGGADGLGLLYVDRHLVHEVSSPQAFQGLAQHRRPVWRADSVLAVADHNVPTTSRAQPLAEGLSKRQLQALESNAQLFALPYIPLRDSRQGIVHVVGPEQGFSLPGLTVVCGDSHTSTHGALACLAFGIGTSELEHVLATQTIWMKKARNLRVSFVGTLPAGVSAKDMALRLIGQIGTAGASACVIEFVGEAVRTLSMEGRMTLCNMAIEAGARSALVAVDDTTIDYVRGRPLAPTGADWDRAEAFWRTLHTDTGAAFDAEVRVDVSTLAPQVTWGTSPEMVQDIDGQVPDPSDAGRFPLATQRADAQRALDYMGLRPGQLLQSIPIDHVFIGSCTNSRIEDLRSAAEVLRGRKVAASVKQALAVPGSGLVRQQAEAEGLDRIFTAAGFEWREPGCSMCVAMNADVLHAGERCASTSNRNFEGRQGDGGRTHLLSPRMAAAAAVAGHLIDPAALPAVDNLASRP
jgi:3-isopropylmalate/(R)-2-methylmalate dehydratase large subunit